MVDFVVLEIIKWITNVLLMKKTSKLLSPTRREQEKTREKSDRKENKLK